MKYLKHRKTWLPAAAIAFLLIVSACRDKKNDKMLEEKGEQNIMTNQAISMDIILLRCEKADDNEIRKIFADLSNPSFVNALDGMDVYGQDLDPPNLTKVLQCLARKQDSAAIADSFVALMKSPMYRSEGNENRLRRNVLIRTSGQCANPNPALIQSLEQEMVNGTSIHGIIAAHALIQLKSESAIPILWNRLFCKETTLLKPNEYEIYAVHYSYEVAQGRINPAILSFMIHRLYDIPELSRAIIMGIREDEIEIGPQAEENIPLPPLNAETPNSIELAKILTLWLSKKGQFLYELDEFPALSKRIPDLLGLEPTQPSGGKAEDIKKWAADLFRQAWEKSDDPQRKEQIQLALNAL